MYKKLLTILLCGCIFAGMAGCAEENTAGNDTIGESEMDQKPTQEKMLEETVDLMDGIELMSTEWNDDFPKHPITGFGVPLFQNALKKAKNDENVLISPMSAWTVLCMVEAGANGETKQQMQEVLAITEGDYLTYAKKFTFLLPEKDNCKVHMANGIWYKNVQSLHVNDYFLQYNKTFFDAAAYKAPFDKNTLDTINDWVSKNTDGMIPSILKEINPEDVLYLVNALSFDAKWSTIYNETQIARDIFTTENGEEKVVAVMNCKENVYLEDENTTGFMKYYGDGQYAFVALLPKEGMTMADYVESLTAEKVRNLFQNKLSTPVSTMLPKFSVDYEFNMNDILMQMGMTDAFSDSDADFTKMATSDAGNIYISSVDQKCFIAVDEYGTKAGAATAVAMQNKALSLQAVKVVSLNRPFVYLIVECDNFEPLFMGTIMNLEEAK